MLVARVRPGYRPSPACRRRRRCTAVARRWAAGLEAQKRSARRVQPPVRDAWLQEEEVADRLRRRRRSSCDHAGRAHSRRHAGTKSCTGSPQERSASAEAWEQGSRSGSRCCRRCLLWASTPAALPHSEVPCPEVAASAPSSPRRHALCRNSRLLCRLRAPRTTRRLASRRRHESRGRPRASHTASKCADRGSELADP